MTQKFLPSTLYSFCHRAGDDWETFWLGDRKVYVDMSAAHFVSGIKFGNARLAFRWMVDTDFGRHHQPMSNEFYRG